MCILNHKGFKGYPDAVYLFLAFILFWVVHKTAPLSLLIKLLFQPENVEKLPVLHTGGMKSSASKKPVVLEKYQALFVFRGDIYKKARSPTGFHDPCHEFRTLFANTLPEVVVMNVKRDRRYT